MGPDHCLRLQLCPLSVPCGLGQPPHLAGAPLAPTNHCVCVGGMVLGPTTQTVSTSALAKKVFTA